ncbi:hypothetical protein [Streptomyces kebangsaanensis]|uniref:hypothetical protein n=1 Tax=Streptomyces kebangsaanensis TaxID=864058 RepID=UPI00094037FA|nr:hypothetical protein [Streptomyces kebangsaanensis]
MQHQFIMLDQGPNFVGWSGLVGEAIVCVMTPKVLTDSTTRRIGRQLVRRQGGDCAACSLTDCPLAIAAPAQS